MHCVALRIDASAMRFVGRGEGLGATLQVSPATGSMAPQQLQVLNRTQCKQESKPVNGLSNVLAA